MPRRPRMYLPNFTYHVVQRGNNREACFLSEECFQFYLDVLKTALHRYNVALHAFCLMTNHVHLLMTPVCKQGISNVMKLVGSRYAYFVNKTYNRSGTLWEGRHKASAIDAENYLLKCYRYIELNPVVADMVSRPEEYRWSSYHYNAWGDKSDVLTPHQDYLQLNINDVTGRQYRYRELFKINLAEEDLHAFRRAAHYSVPVGSDRFIAQIEEKTGQKVGYSQRGRPKAIGSD